MAVDRYMNVSASKKVLGNGFASGSKKTVINSEAKETEPTTFNAAVQQRRENYQAGR